MKIKEYKPKNFPDYVKIISENRRRHEKIWFRGVNNENYNLVPSILRRKDLKDRSRFSNLESEIMSRFKERSLPYLDHIPANDWDWLFFMQHYGIPTRLLDWTENPFISLFFSINNSQKTTKGIYKNNAVVWMVDPINWNNSVLEFQGYTDGILSTTAEQLNPFRPPAEYKSIPDYCLALNGAYNSTRIVAQRGAFFIFGSPGKAMNKYYEEKISVDCLSKIIIEKEYIEDIKNDLLGSGITESVVFPDLEGLSIELNRNFGFGV